MELIEVNKLKFKSIIPEPFHCFNDAFFNELNKKNCENLYYILFKDKKFRLGIIGGKIENNFHSPFSAPFGGFSYVSNSLSHIKYLESASKLLEDFCNMNGMNKINITLPPSIYNSNFITKQLNSLFRLEYKILSIELNCHFKNNLINNNYIDNLATSSRKFLKQSFKSNLTFYKCTNLDDNIEAYRVIVKNRSIKNLPLRMKFEDIEKTEIKKDFFLIKNANNINIAGAIVYHVSSNIVQVVYWGDDPDYQTCRPMNFLSYNIFSYYNSIGILYTDVGPSSENSKPNYGLCNFKESIGCKILPKIVLQKIL